MILTVIMFFSPSVCLCYVPAPYLLNDWKLIKEMSKARILVVGNFSFNGSFSQYYSLFRTSSQRDIEGTRDTISKRKKTPNNPT